jgi:hypothetical protein
MTRFPKTSERSRLKSRQIVIHGLHVSYVTRRDPFVGFVVRPIRGDQLLELQ